MDQLEIIRQLLQMASNTSVFTRKDLNKIIVRRKGGPSKEKYKNSPVYANSRKVNHEFGGRSTTVKWFTPLLAPVWHISDYSVTGELNALLKPVQEMDIVSKWGQRNVLLSLNPKILEGLNLNRKNLLESVIKPGVQATVSKETMSGLVHIPALLPGKNFIVPRFFPWYRLTTILGVIPDHLYTKNKYRPAGEINHPHYVIHNTDWQDAKEKTAAFDIALSMPRIVNPPAHSLMLLLGISFGVFDRIKEVAPVQHMGAAKIICMA
jgi:hypothetical protein